MDQAIQHPHPRVFTQTLRDEALVMLLRGVGAVAVAPTFLGLLAVGSEPGVPAALEAGLVLLVSCWGGRALRVRGRYRSAVALLLGAMLVVLALTVGAYGLGRNPFIFFVPLLVGVTVLLLRPIDGLLAATVAFGLMIATAFVAGYSAELSGLRFIAAVLLGYLSAGLMWLSSQGFVAAVEWAISAYAQIERRETQLFESERRLQRALSEREYLNGQLLNSNRALERARAAAEEANRLKSQFVRNMSHELRTPLNAILGFSYILKQQIAGPLNADQLDHLGRIYDAGDHLLRLLNDVLDHAKLEAGKLDLQREPVLFENIAHDVLQTAASLTHNKPVVLCHEIDPDLPLVFVDRLRIVQVLLNLLSNALKFTEQGQILLRAYSGAAGTATSGWVYVEVQDSGIGIAPEHLGIIFEEYRQVEETLSRRYGGTGLGLPISRRLVELHGGSLSVESTLGHGSTFRFSLPVAVGVEQAAA